MQSDTGHIFGGYSKIGFKVKNIPEWKLDNNCFLFSLDRQKIYYPKNNAYFQLACYPKDGPSFANNGIYCIELFKNALQNNNLRTNEKCFKELFEGDINALSEDGNYNGVFAKEYEAFQIIF